MAFRQYIVAGDAEPIFVNETGQRQYIVGGVAFINDSGFTSQSEPWQKARRKHARPLRRQTFGNVAATIPVVATFTGYARPRIQKARRRHYAPLRHRPYAPVIPVVPPAPLVSHGYIKWTKPHRKRDAHAEILAIVRQVAAGPQPEAVPLEPVVVETIAQQVAEQIRPTIDTEALVSQITAAIVAHYAQMDEEDTETLLTGLL